jgi:hypothetical protein
MLLDALAQPGFGFLSNDRILLEADLHGRVPLARRSPTIVRIRPESLSYVTSLSTDDWHRTFPYGLTPAEAADRPAASTQADPRDPRALFSMSPAQFCRWRDVPLGRGAMPIRALVFPQLDRTAGPFRLEQLTPRAAAGRLAGSVMAQPPWPPCAAAFDRLPSLVAARPATPDDVCRRLSPGALIDCRLGEAAFRDGRLWPAIVDASGGGGCRSSAP